jgi:hypothetical protein
MTLTILRLLSLIPTALKLRSELALENLAQLAVLNHHHRRPELWKSDRVFWGLLSHLWVCPIGDRRFLRRGAEHAAGPRAG